MSVDPAVVDFERRLDLALSRRPTHRCGGVETIHQAANVVEFAWTERRPVAEGLASGLEILAPTLISRPEGKEIPVEALIKDLDFASHYWRLREFLYFTYNAPWTVSWTFADDCVDIAYADESLPRQFFLAANNFYLESLEAFGSQDRTSEIEELVRGAPEFEQSSAFDEAMPLIEEEVAIKFSAYFNLVPDLDPPLGEFSFQQLVETYRCLLVKALWHRYHATVNDARGALVLPIDAMAHDLAQSSDLLDEDAARWALKTMSYGEEARAAGENAVYFSLYSLPADGRVVMMPHDFAVWEGFVNLLRLIASREPQTYLASFSGPIGTALTKRIGNVFEEAGFWCKTDVSLSRFSKELPDIDLVVVSEEPTLGYVLLLCEVKAPLPPRWAKDQLRVLAPDSVAKAFVQLDRIGAFLATDEGLGFVRELLPAESIPRFDGFAVASFLVVITSDNAGAFFADRTHAIVDFRTLSRLLRRCDGDIEYVLRTLRELPQLADRCLGRRQVEAEVGPMKVRYEGVTIDCLLDFEQAEFRSAGVPERMADEMLQAGDRPLDVLRARGMLDDDHGN